LGGAGGARKSSSYTSLSKKHATNIYGAIPPFIDFRVNNKAGMVKNPDIYSRVVQQYYYVFSFQEIGGGLTSDGASPARKIAI
jgi:hypothetical protein